MSVYSDIAALRRNPAFLDQCTASCLKSANYLLLVETPATANFTNRVRWAQTTLRNPDGMGLMMSGAVASHVNLEAKLGDPESITDADVQGLVDSFVNTFANAQLGY